DLDAAARSDAGADVPGDPQVRVDQHLSGHRLAAPDRRLRSVPDAAIDDLDSEGLYRGGSDRRGRRAAHPLADHRAAVLAGPVGARDLLLPRQLGSLFLAADGRFG